MYMRICYICIYIYSIYAYTYIYMYMRMSKIDIEHLSTIILAVTFEVWAHEPQYLIEIVENQLAPQFTI